MNDGTYIFQDVVLSAQDLMKAAALYLRTTQFRHHPNLRVTEIGVDSHTGGALVAVEMDAQPDQESALQRASPN